MTRTQARSDCGHCSNGPKTVDGQSSSRILAPISPPPANTESINCVFSRSMAESLDSPPQIKKARPKDILFLLVQSTHDCCRKRQRMSRLPHSFCKQRSSDRLLADFLLSGARPL